MFSKATRLIKDTVSALSHLKSKGQATQAIQGNETGADKNKAKKAKKAKKDFWPFCGVEDGDENDEWSLVDIWEAEELEQEAEERADPLNINIVRDLQTRINYTQVTWEAFKDFMGGKKQGFRQIGW